MENYIAEDEISAHTGMFEAATNNSYYGLGLEVAKIIREAITTSRGNLTNEPSPQSIEATHRDGHDNAQSDNLINF